MKELIEDMKRCPKDYAVISGWMLFFLILALV